MVFVCFQFATTSSDDSSSCDSESIRMTRRGGYRPGIRMGTLRELSHSDPDYTSSSEQSCDTVIYRGPFAARALSDQGGETTDGEHPPAALPIRPRVAPKTQPRTVPTFNRSRSSGDEGSESDRSSAISSPAHDSRLPRPHPKDSRARHALTSSPLKNSRQSPTHLQNYRANAYPQHNFVPGYLQDGVTPQAVYGQNASGERWIDGPLHQPLTSQQGQYNQQYASATSVNGTQHFLPNGRQEHWVDGPNALPQNPVNQQALNEQWIDGPRAFVVRNTASHVSQSPQPSAPPPSQHQSPSRYAQKHPGTYAHAQTHQSLEDITPGATPPHVSQTPTPHVSQTRAENVGRSSRSNVLETIEESKHETNTLDNKQPVKKSFVSDWLDKHNGGVTSEVVGDAARSHKSRSRHDKLKLQGEELLSGNKSSRKSSRNSSPRSSPSRSPRKDAQVPATSKPSQRTIAWVESMSEARTHCDGQEAYVAPTDGRAVTDAQQAPNPANDMQDTMQSFNDVISSLDKEIHSKTKTIADPVVTSQSNASPPPAYDVIVSRVAQLSPTKSKADDIMTTGDLNDNVSKSDLTMQNIMNKVIADLDESQDSDVAPVSHDKYDVITNLFMSNRESIYELQVDEQLETSRSSVRNSFHSEDDTWSLAGSIPKESDELKAIRYANMTNKILDNIEVPSLTQLQDDFTYKVSTLDSGNGTQLDNSFATTELDSKTSRVDLDTSTGVSTMESCHRSRSDVIVDLEKEYSHILTLCNYDDSQDVVSLAPPRSVEQNSVAGLTGARYNPVRPSNLRRPDGSSNPNLCDQPTFSTFSSLNQQRYVNTAAVSAVGAGGGSGGVPAAEQNCSNNNCSGASTSSHVTRERSPKPCKNSASNKSASSAKPAVQTSATTPSSSPAKSPDVAVKPTPKALALLSREHWRSSSVKSESSRHSSSQSSTRSHSAPAVKPGAALPAKTKQDKSSGGAKNSKSTPANGGSAQVTHKPPKTQSKSSFASRLPLCNGKRKDKDKEQTISPKGAAPAAC